MLERICEPEAMDTVEDATDYDSMDFVEVNRKFIADFLSVWNGQSPILDVGTGTARIPIEFCHQSPHGIIDAIDVAEQMLAVARRNVQQAGLTERIRLHLVNAREMPFGDGSFPAIMSNSIVHHLHEPIAFFTEVERLLAGGGCLFVRDLFRPDSKETIDQLVQQYAGGENEHSRQLFRDSFYAALTLDEVRDMVQQVGFDPAGVVQSSDRHWTWIIRKR